MPSTATCLAVYIVGHQRIAYHPAHRHPAGYHHGVAAYPRPVATAVSQRQLSLYGEIDTPARPAAVGVRAGQEGARRPLRGVLHVVVAVRVAGDGVACVEVGAVIERTRRDEDVHHRPYHALQ